MVPALASVIALQQLDSAADAARRRLAELPAAETAAEDRVTAAAAAVDTAKTRLQENHEQRLVLDRNVAAVDMRLARFEEHKAAVKTNQEYQALQHEVAVAKAEKDAIEDRILLLMDAADRLTADLKGSEAAFAQAKADAIAQRAALTAERAALDAELARLAAAREGEARNVSPALLARYGQLLKSRRGLAVAAIAGDVCSACHVRLRPHVAQLIRRNEEVVQCESCQRILYYQAPGPGA